MSKLTRYVRKPIFVEVRELRKDMWLIVSPDGDQDKDIYIGGEYFREAYEHESEFLARFLGRFTKATSVNCPECETEFSIPTIIIPKYKIEVE